MIQIKNRPDTLPSFSGERVENLRNQLRVKIANGETITNTDIDDSVWKKAEVRNILFNSQNKKCCFCENIRAKKREFDGEHFRPKLAIIEELEHPGYWWLAYEWSNIFYACKTCNQEYKKIHFPIRGNRARNEGDSLEDEQGVLVHPQNENPEDFIGFDWQQGYGKFVKATGLDENNRGNETIHIVGLNDGQLMEERAETIKLLQDAVFSMKRYQDLYNIPKRNQQAELIRELTSAKKRFAGFHRAFFRAAGLGEFVAND